MYTCLIHYNTTQTQIVQHTHNAVLTTITIFPPNKQQNRILQFHMIKSLKPLIKHRTQHRLW